MLFVDVVFARFVRENEYIERFEQCSMMNITSATKVLVSIQGVGGTRKFERGDKNV